MMRVSSSLILLILLVVGWSKLVWSQNELPPPDLSQLPPPGEDSLPPPPVPPPSQEDANQNSGNDSKNNAQNSNNPSGSEQAQGNQQQNQGKAPSDGEIINPFGGDLSGTDSQTAELKESVLQEFLQPYLYSSDGRRDPFAQPVIERPLDPLPKHGPVLPLQTIRVDQIQVKAILWNVANPKAIVQLPSGNIVTVKLKDRLGGNNGYVAAIREGEIVLVETFEENGRVFSSTKILTLNQ